jgi:hypothetical protein
MGMNDTSINAFNAQIRAQPWYQNWFTQRGLDPNRVKLDDRQREELKQLVEAQSGFKFPGDMKIDPAGNLNEKGGWAGLPTGVKIALIAGATIATAGAAGAFSGAAGAAGAAGGGTSAAATGLGAAVPTIGSTAIGTGLGVAPSLAGASTVGGSIAGGAAAAGGGGSLLGTLGAAAQMGGRLTGAAGAQRSEDRGAQAEYDVARVPTQNAQALQYANARTNADMNRTRQIGSADMLSNFKAPTDPRAQKFLNNGQLSGGQMNPETISMMRDRAMKALESGSDVPQMQTIPDQPGGGPTRTDSLLRTLGMAGTALSAWDLYRGGR